MFAPSARSVVVAAAVALTGTAAFGQQLANVDTDRASYLAAHCDHIRDPNRQVGCYAEKSLEFSRAQTAVAKQTTATAEKTITASDALRPCLQFLKGKRDAGTVFSEAITRDNACSLAREHGMKDGPS
jgi:hypothetical protein